MKHKRLTTALVLVVVALAIGGCDVYESVEIKVVRPPKIENDTIMIPDWEIINNKETKL